LALVFARLKLRLLRNGMRSTQRAVMLVIGAAVALWFAALAFSALASLRTDTAEAGDLTVVLFGSIAIGWTLLPVLGYGSDETLDPQRLALLPLNGRQLVTGMLVASAVGIAPVATLLALSGALVALPHDVVQFALVLAGVLGTALLCVVASRTLVTALSPLLRSRRGRDVIIVAVTILAIAPQALRFIGPGRSGGGTRHQLEVAARAVRWTPFALGGTTASEAGRGHLGRSALALVALAAVVGVLLVLWNAALRHALTTADASATPKHRRRARSAALPLFPRSLAWLPHDRAGAVAAKDLRYFMRDPRRRAAMIGALAFPAVLFISTASARAPSHASTLLALLALFPASQLSLNQFGLEGAAAWVYVASGDDPRADMTGKNVATALFVVPFAVAAAVAFAAVSGGWGYLPLTLGLVPAALGVLLGVGNVASVVVPYAVPERRNPLATNTGQGCLAGLTSLAGLALEMLLLLPAAAAVAIALAALPLAAATVVGIGVADAYGLVVWLAGRQIATAHVRTRLPELLESVSPRQAA
jgi:ABC-2 type transport system permease protein